MATANANFSALVATTLKNYRRRLHDNVTENQILLSQLRRRGYVEERDGGTTIVEPLLHEFSSTVKSFAGFDVLDTTPQTGISAAEYDWKQIAGTVSISGEEMFKNSGSTTQVLSLLESKIRQLDLSMRSVVNTQLFSDGTGNGGKDIGGLALLVEDGTAFSTVGGIDSNVQTFWRNQFVDVDANFSAAHGATSEGIFQIRNIMNSASRPGTRTDLIVTTQAIFELYTADLGQNKRHVNSELADAGFTNVELDGVPMVWDADVSAKDVFLLNSEFLKFVIGRGRDFEVTEVQGQVSFSWLRPAPVPCRARIVPQPMGSGRRDVILSRALGSDRCGSPTP